jgi:hypothetical protein
MGFMKYLETSLSSYHRSMATIKGMYYPQDESRFPVLIAEKCKSLKKVVMSTKMEQVDQVSFLLDIANYISTIENCDQSIHIKIDPSTLFACDDGNGQLVAKVYPLFEHSYIIQQEKRARLSIPVEDLIWMNEVTKHLQFGYDSSEPLPEDHLMKKMFDQKWLSNDDRIRPANLKILSDDLQNLLGALFVGLSAPMAVVFRGGLISCSTKHTWGWLLFGVLQTCSQGSLELT